MHFEYKVDCRFHHRWDNGCELMNGPTFSTDDISLLLANFELPEELYHELVELRFHGQHFDAITMVNQLPLSLGQKCLLKARLNSELLRFGKARGLLKQARKHKVDESLIRKEYFFADFQPKAAVDMVNLWMSHSPAQDQESIQNAIQEIAHGLASRLRKKSALEFLRTLRSAGYEIPVTALEQELREKTKSDLYYNYYGYWIMGFQILLTGSLLLLCIYHGLNSYHEYYKILLTAFASASIADHQEFSIAFGKIFKVFLIFVALLPALIINLKMISARMKKDSFCHVEVYERFLRVRDFNFVYHLEIDNEKHPLFLYMDDNDFNYLHLIRHFPLVPNLTYCYAFDLLRGTYINSPLYGFSDGRDFKEQHLKNPDLRVVSMNMIAVRFTQLFSSLDRMSTKIRQLVFVIFIASLSLLSHNLFFSQSGRLLFQYLLFALFALWLIQPQLAGWFRYFLERSRMASPLRVPVLNKAIMLLAVWMFYKHYQPYELSGLFLTIFCSGAFYFLFVSNRYDSKAKQLIAMIEASKGSPEEYPDLKCVSLGKDKSGNSCSLFFSKESFALPVYFLGHRLMWKVFDSSSELGLKDSTLKVDDYELALEMEEEEILCALDQSGLKVAQETTQSGFNLSKWSPHMGLICIVFWSLTQIYAEWTLQPHPAIQGMSTYQEQVTRTDLTAQILENFEINTKGEIWHRLEGNRWVLDFDRKNKAMVLKQLQTASWKGIESVLNESLLDKLDRLPRYPFLYPGAFRDSSIEFLSWWFVRSRLRAHPSRDRDFLKVYCGLQGLGFSNGLCSANFELPWVHLTLTRIPEFKTALERHPGVRELLVLDTASRAELINQLQDKEQLTSLLDLYFPALSEVKDEKRRKRALRKLKVDEMNSIGMLFQKIPAGQFQMGSNFKKSDVKKFMTAGFNRMADPKRTKDERPMHTVRISNSFLMQKTEVTQTQWLSLMEKLPERIVNCPDCPVTQVKYSKAVEFLERLNKKEGCEFSQSEIWDLYGTQGSSKARGCYRLPTEAEWEYSCLSRRQKMFGHGDDGVQLLEYAWVVGGALGMNQVSAVGHKRENLYRLHDMHGNAFEWVHDYYQARYYKKSPGQDPKGPEDGRERVVRGGNFNSNEFDSRCSARTKLRPERFSSKYYTGFRAVRNL